MNLRDEIRPYGEEITTGMSDSVLSGLYRTILNDLGIEEVRFLNLVHKYSERTATPTDAKELSSAKGNYRNELLKSVMTWKVFIKGLHVINVTRCQVGIQVEFNNPERKPVSVAADLQLFDPKTYKELPRDDTFLSNLYRQLMFVMNVDQIKFQELMRIFIMRSQVERNMKEISSARGNIKKELMHDKMSWKVFVKGLVFLDVYRFVIAVDLHHRRGDITNHKRSIILELGMLDQSDD